MFQGSEGFDFVPHFRELWLTLLLGLKICHLKLCLYHEPIRK